MSLPSGYKQLQYIEGDGSAYIDTNFKANQNTSAEVEFSTKETPTNIGVAVLFGSSGAWSNASFGFYKFATWYSNYNSDTTLPDVTIPTGTKVKVYKNKNLVYIDDTLVYTHAEVTFQATTNLLLGRISISNQYGSYAKFYSCKIWDNDTLVREYIPAKNSSGVIGMYDTVTNTFFTNAGSGSFIAGPDAETIYSIKKDCFVRKLLPDGYTKLEYIHTEGDAWIDTGLSLTSFLNKTDSRIVMKIAWTNITQGIYQVNGWGNNPQIGIQSARTASGNAYWQNYNTGTEPITQGEIYTATLDFAGNVGTLKVDGFADLRSVSTTQSTSTFLIGGFTGGGNLPYENIYEVWIYQDGLIRHYIPCKNSSNVVGMYDMVAKTFHSSASTNAFTAGPEVPSYQISTIKKDCFVIPNPEAHNLPSGYTEYEYINMTTAGGYIDTEIKAQHEAFKVEIDASLTSSQGMLGAQVGPGNTSTHLVYSNNFYIGNSEDTVSGIFSPTTRATIILESTSDKHYSVTKYDGTTSTGTYTGTIISNKNYYLYAMNAASLNAAATGQIYSVKLYDNGVLVGHFVPAKNSGDEIGMYNLVDNTFHKKQGSGVIKVGPEVPQYSIKSIKQSKFFIWG